MKIGLFFITIACLASTYASSNRRYSNTRLARDTYAEELRQVETCNFNICEDAPTYPANQIRRTIDRHQALHSFFDGDVFKTSKDSIIGLRSGTNLEYFCKSRDVKTRPKLMKDIENIARVIVNVGDYRQVLQYQVCQNIGSQCMSEVPNGYETKCEQKYNNIKLVTINVTSLVTEYKSFKIPTTCVCTYKRNF